MFNKTGVYIIENLKTNKCYVGSTCVNFKRRFSEHLGQLRRDTHHSKKLQRSYNKHGKEFFRFRILEVCDKEVARELEQKWMDRLMPFYNMTLTVDGGADNHSYETKLKLSRSLGGKPIEIYNLDGDLLKTVNFQHEASDFVGGIQSVVWKCLKGIGDTYLGHRFKYQGEEFLYENRRVPTYGMLGKSHTEATKVAMSKASKGKKKSKSHTKSISLEMKRQWASGERTQSPITDNTKINMARAKFSGILVVGDKKENEIMSCWSISDASNILDIKSSSIAGVLGGHRNSVYGYKFNKKPLVSDFPRLESKEDLKE